MKISPDAKRSIARKLRDLREQKGLTQAELGRQIGRAFTTIASWESGKGQPDADTLLRLLAFYQVENVLEEFGYTQKGVPLARDERAHIDRLRQLPEDARALIYDLAKGLQRIESGRAATLRLAARGGEQPSSLTLSGADELSNLPDEGWKGEKR